MMLVISYHLMVDEGAGRKSNDSMQHVLAEQALGQH